MPRDLTDSDPRKWVYSDHARAKHAIQRTYLGAWLAILGTHYSPLILFDGFAGRGRYEGGQEGSPVLFFRRAVEAVERGRPEEVRIRCVERDQQNFESLQAIIADLHHPKVTIDARCGTFSQQALSSVEKLGARDPVPPVFWTADPFGFSGVPLSTVQKLLSLPRSEVMLTFMVRDMRRFLAEPNHQVALTEFYGGDAWRKCLETDNGEEREQCLLLTYSALIRSGIAKFATPFRVFEDDRRQTLYYLVHLTNSGKGMREMKRAMVKESKDMTFWPVTVRPPEQLAFDVEEEAPYPTLQAYLAKTYLGRAMSFEQLLDTDYPEGLWLEPDYRAALLAMEGRGSVLVSRDRSTPGGRAPSGLKETDQLDFSGQASLL